MGEKTPKFSVVFLAVALVLGIAVGYGVNNVITSPKIGSLREEMENKNDQIISLQSDMDLLEENVTSLMTSLNDLTELYDDLAENTVPKSQHDALAIEHQALTVDYDALEENYIALKAQSSSLEPVIEELTEENQELLDEYEKLLDKYTEIRVLSWTNFDAHGLRVNLTTTTTTYDENMPIIGSISIYHENNRPFNGTIILMLWSDFYSNGRTSDEISIYGNADYSFNSPFVLGPGTYYLRVSEINDEEGKTVVTAYEVNEFRIKITMG